MPIRAPTPCPILSCRLNPGEIWYLCYMGLPKKKDTQEAMCCKLRNFMAHFHKRLALGLGKVHPVSVINAIEGQNQVVIMLLRAAFPSNIPVDIVKNGP